MFSDAKIKELEQKINNLVRVGIVTNILADTGKVKVKFEETGNMLSYDLPVLFSKTQDDKFYFMPDIGEQVLCVFLPFGLEQGFILGSFYSSKDLPSVSDKNKSQIKFKDGTIIEYDREAKKLLIDCNGDISIKCTNAEVKAEKVEIDSESIDLGKGGKGVVTGDCICAYTGLPHEDKSEAVRAVK